MTTIRSLAALILLLSTISASAKPWEAYMYCYRENVNRTYKGPAKPNETVILAPKLVETCVRVAPPASATPDPLPQHQSPAPPRVPQDLSCKGIGDGIDRIKRAQADLRKQAREIQNEISSEEDVLIGTNAAKDKLGGEYWTADVPCTADESAYNARKRAIVATARCPTGSIERREACLDKLFLDHALGLVSLYEAMEKSCGAAEAVFNRWENIIDVAKRLSSHLQGLREQQQQLTREQGRLSRLLKTYQDAWESNSCDAW